MKEMIRLKEILQKMNLLRCKTCKKIITSEEVKNHNYCNVEIKNYKTIYASHLATLTNDDGEKCALVEGLDGVSYRIIEKRPNLVEYTPELNADQPTGNTDKSNLRCNSTIKQYSYKVLVPYYTVW